jgi:hypothetical protein
VQCMPQRARAGGMASVFFSPRPPRAVPSPLRHALNTERSRAAPAQPWNPMSLLSAARGTHGTHASLTPPRDHALRRSWLLLLLSHRPGHPPRRVTTPAASNAQRLLERAMESNARKFLSSQVSAEQRFSIGFVSVGVLCGKQRFNRTIVQRA